MTRRLLLLSVAMMIAGCADDTAQPEGESGAAPVDFSGVYAPAPFVARPELFLPEVFPFTDRSQAAFAAFDPLVDNPRLQDDCAEETMPAVLWLGAPMEITQHDDHVVLRFERGGVERDVSMGGNPPVAEESHSALGHSTGRWDGDVLTIETTHLAGGAIINNQGYPLSRDAVLTERYWREPGEMDLQLEVTIDDPVNYTQPFVIGRVWVWAPDEQVAEWKCIDLGSRETEIDIDELARQLEQL